MIIRKIKIQNFRGYKTAELNDLSEINACVGKNDSGKSTILEAIPIFLNPKYKTKKKDFYLEEPNEMFIEIYFMEFPSKIIINGIEIDLDKTGYVHQNGFLIIRKTYSDINDTGYYSFLSSDFENIEYRNLMGKNEKRLNELLDEFVLDSPKSGRGITNYSKLCQLRNHLFSNEERLVDDILIIDPDKDFIKELSRYFPIVLLHVKSREEEDVDNSNVQNFFRELVSLEEACKDELEVINSAIQIRIEEAFEQIHKILNEHLPNQFSEITPIINLDSRKIFSVDIILKDSSGIQTPYLSRGTGTKRLLTLSVIQHIASSQINYEKDIPTKLLLLMEEPETYLHPEAQRSLAKSIKTISEDPDYQIFVTSHSPSVISEIPLDSIFLTKYSSEGCTITKDINYFSIAEELGIRPSDSLLGYDLCIFVEGQDDVKIFKHILSEFYKNEIKDDIRNIGIIPSGGSNLFSLVSFKLLHRINNNFIIILDSDKISKDDDLHVKKLIAKEYAEKFGGTCYILRKREIENYIHTDAILRRLGKHPNVEYFKDEIRNIDDFTDVKKLLIKILEINKSDVQSYTIPSFQNMTLAEFKEKQVYIKDKQNETYEFDEIVAQIVEKLE